MKGSQTRWQYSQDAVRQIRKSSRAGLGEIEKVNDFA